MKCPECGSGQVYHSRALTLRDRALKRLLPVTFYRCHSCGWRRMRSRNMQPREAALHALSIVGYVGAVGLALGVLAAIVYGIMTTLGLPAPWSK